MKAFSIYELVRLAVFSTVFLMIQVTAEAALDPNDPLPRTSDQPLEKLDGVITQYGSVEVEPGVRLRSLVTRPEESSQPLYPILFAQWVSCGSLELKQGSTSQLAMLARDSELTLVRVDRAGAGDSQGPDCDQLDYNTEVAHYITAFEQLLQRTDIDASKVFIFGSSLGSTTAPLIAASLQEKGFNIAGIVVQGGGALTHLERMINFDRFYLERRPGKVAPEDIHQQMNDRIAFQTEYLAKGRHPDDIAKDSPAMHAVRADTRGLNETNHYGRPFAWHQQAAQRNFLQAWSTLDARVLVIFNEFDQFETLHGHQLIVDTVNRLRPGTAELIIQKGLGHSSYRFNSMEEAYAHEVGVPEPQTTGKVILDWLKTFDSQATTKRKLPR